MSGLAVMVMLVVTFPAASIEPLPDWLETNVQVPGLKALIVKFGADDVTEQMLGVCGVTVTACPIFVLDDMLPVLPY